MRSRLLFAKVSGCDAGFWRVPQSVRLALCSLVACGCGATVVVARSEPTGKARTYHEVSIGGGLDLLLADNDAPEERRTFDDPAYGPVKVPSFDSGARADGIEGTLPRVDGFVEGVNEAPYVEGTYSYGTRTLRLRTGMFSSWLPPLGGTRVTGYLENPWDEGYFAGFDSAPSFGPFLGVSSASEVFLRLDCGIRWKHLIWIKERGSQLDMEATRDERYQGWPLGFGLRLSVEFVHPSHAHDEPKGGLPPTARGGAGSTGITYGFSVHSLPVGEDDILSVVHSLAWTITLSDWP